MDHRSVNLNSILFFFHLLQYFRLITFYFFILFNAYAIFSQVGDDEDIVEGFIFPFTVTFPLLDSFQSIIYVVLGAFFSIFLLSTFLGGDWLFIQGDFPSSGGRGARVRSSSSMLCELMELSQRLCEKKLHVRTRRGVGVVKDFFSVLFLPSREKMPKETNKLFATSY